MFCPECKNEWGDEYVECPICSRDFDDPGSDQWVLLGSIRDKLSADFAREVLASYKIPAVVISKSGFFGNIGLTLNTFYKPGSSLFEVSVPMSLAEDAKGILEMALGDSWLTNETDD